MNSNRQFPLHGIQLNIASFTFLEDGNSTKSIAQGAVWDMSFSHWNSGMPEALLEPVMILTVARKTSQVSLPPAVLLQCYRHPGPAWPHSNPKFDIYCLSVVAEVKHALVTRHIPRVYLFPLCWLPTIQDQNKQTNE